MNPWGMRLLHMGCGEPLFGTPGLVRQRPGSGLPPAPPPAMRQRHPGPGRGDPP
jgi:hypothetical protein